MAMNGNFGESRIATRAARERRTASILRALARRYAGGYADAGRARRRCRSTRIAARGDDQVWIDLRARDELLRDRARPEAQGPAGKPLYGIPFAIKDNIDLAGHPTTAACPDFAYVARESAHGRAALGRGGRHPDRQDQSRSVRHRPRRHALALWRAAERASLRTIFPADRVPARRSRSRRGWSASRSAPTPPARAACRRRSTISSASSRPAACSARAASCRPAARSIASRSSRLPRDDARDVLRRRRRASTPPIRFRAASGAHGRPPLPARCRRRAFGVPRAGELEFFGNDEGERLFGAMLAAGSSGSAASLSRSTFAPFLETARLLYEGPWVAERYVAIRDFIDRAARKRCIR